MGKEVLPVNEGAWRQTREAAWSPLREALALPLRLEGYVRGWSAAWITCKWNPPGYVEIGEGRRLPNRTSWQHWRLNISIIWSKQVCPGSVVDV